MSDIEIKPIYDLLFFSTQSLEAASLIKSLTDFELIISSNFKYLILKNARLSLCERMDNVKIYLTNHEFVNRSIAVFLHSVINTLYTETVDST